MLKFGLGLFFSSLLLFLGGCESTGLDAGQYQRARFVLESTSQDGYAALVTLPLSRVQVPVQGDAILSEFDYRAIDLVDVELGRCLVFSLKPPAARAFYQLTVANQGKRLVLVVNGQPLGVRCIDGPISDGRIYVFLEITDEALEALAEQLRKTNFDIQEKLSR